MSFAPHAFVHAPIKQTFMVTKEKNTRQYIYIN